MVKLYKSNSFVIFKMEKEQAAIQTLVSMNADGIIIASTNEAIAPYLDMCQIPVIAIGDCGLPIPDEVERIDLALKFGVPTFMETLATVAEDMKIEKIILAEEIKTQNPKVLSEIEMLVAEHAIETQFVSHAELKALTHDCKAVIRTGETTPYANIILQSGYIFA